MYILVCTVHRRSKLKHGSSKWRPWWMTTYHGLMGWWPQFVDIRHNRRWYMCSFAVDIRKDVQVWVGGRSTYFVYIPPCVYPTPYNFHSERVSPSTYWSHFMCFQLGRNPTPYGMPFHVPHSMSPTPSVCISLCVYPNPSVSNSSVYPHSVCISFSVPLRLHRNLCIPLCTCKCPISRVSNSGRAPLLYPTPFVSHPVYPTLCLPLRVCCLTPSVSHSVCVPHHVFPSQCESQYVCAPVRVRPVPYVFHHVKFTSGVFHFLCILISHFVLFHSLSLSVFPLCICLIVSIRKRLTSYFWNPWCALSTPCVPALPFEWPTKGVWWE